LIGNLNRAAELIEAFKQVATDQTHSEQRTFNISEHTKQLLMSLRPALRKMDVTLEVECEDDLVMNSYPGAYGQVLTNLFLNSVTHAFPQENGSIQVKVRALDNENVMVVFADNGCGMDSIVKRQAFNPFFTTRRDKGCSGLGLHIVHNIVTHRLGGRLSLDSSLGAGTIIQLILPRLPKSRPESTSQFTLN
jgi:signal transduction histidine kinase